jgi:hypothetical protein
MDKEIENLIEEARDETNLGGPEKIYTYLQKYHKDAQISRADIKEYVAKQEDEQILKKQNIKKAGLGHIVASYILEIVQMDLFDLSKYDSSNDGYKYIMAFVDVFTRFAVCVPMKTKSIDDTTNALNTFISSLGVPIILMSDNDSAFTGEKFQSLLDENNIIFEPNVVGDHFALGIIDNFARRIKEYFTKKNLKVKTDKYRWVNFLLPFIVKYNESPHMALDGLSPIESAYPENYAKIYGINAVKGLKNKTVSDLEIGDKVRIKVAGKFSKSSEPQYSDEVYTVESVKGSTIHLSNGEVKKRNNLLKVPKETQSSSKNVVTKALEKAKDKRRFNREGLN